MKKLLLVAGCAALLMSLAACHPGCRKHEETPVVPTPTEQPAPTPAPEAHMPTPTK